jgi:RNA polymerase sigma factor (sigma-70 family)
VLRADDVDDAFQATFLALAKQAGSIRRQEAVGAWLYEVAYNTALKARARRTRIQRVEQAAAPFEATGPGDEAVVYRDLQQVLDEELHRLPERLRRPLVIVHLLGRTQADAARELGITDRAVRKRLQAGRERLRLGLTRRGVTLTAAALAAVLGRQANAGAVPPGLVRPTVESVLAYAAGQTGAVPAGTVSLAMAGVGGWLAGRFKLVCLLVAIPALAALVFTAYALTPAAPDSPALPQVPLAPPVAHDEAAGGRTVVLTGRVLAADGQPVPHAAVTALVRRPWQPAGRGLHDEVVARGTADAAGRYRLAVPADFPTWSAERRVTLLAHAPGRAPVTADVPLRGRPAAADLRLPGSAAVRGRLIGPDGKPAAGVRLAIVRLGPAAREITQGDEPPPSPPGWPADVASDADGRFRLDGLPEGETLWLQVQDDRYALTTFPASVGAAEPLTVTLAGPRLLTGRVVAEDTGRPLGGARVSVVVGPERKTQDHYTALAAAPDAAAAAPPVEMDGRADADGRFQLRLPPEEAYHVYVNPPEGATCLGRHGNLAWADGETARKLTVVLPVGVEVRGRVVEEDGRPIDGACVSYVAYESRSNLPSRDNLPSRQVRPFRADQLLFSDTAAVTGADGHFRIVVPTGPSALRVIGPTADYRQHDYAYQPCPECGKEHMRFVEHARVAFDLAPGARPDPVRVTLRRGTAVAGRAVGPDGMPIRDGILVCRTVVQPLRSLVPRTLPVRDGSFALPGCVPGRTYPVLLLDPARGQAAAAELQVPRAGDPLPTVRLAPCGAAEVRLTDAAGRPIAGQRPFVRVWLSYDRPAGEPESAGPNRRPVPMDPSWVDPRHYLPGPATDADGRIVLPALVPGLEYSVSFLGDDRRYFHAKPFRVAPGQVVRLPDIVSGEDEAGGHPGDEP